jgi:transposase
MSLRPRDFSVVPEDTDRVARAAFPKGNPYLKLRDELGVIYEDHSFAALFGSARGRPAESPGCLALVTVLQFAENLSDRQAAEAVRGRIDWKYLLGLELTDAGFDYTLLHEFRQRVLEHRAEQQLLNSLLELFKTRKLLKVRGKQRTDSTHVLAAIQILNRLELAGETLRHVLNVLAAVLPDWIREQAAPEWFERYGRPFTQWRLPRAREERVALAEQIGQDGLQLWQMMERSAHWTWLREVPAVDILRQVWLQQYYEEEGTAHWRKGEDLPPKGKRIVSPYDPEARKATKGQTHWCGYKVHVTETCDEDQPRLITHVETTSSTTEDVDVTATIHQHLREKELLPKEHLVDAGYTDARTLAESPSQFEIDLVGRVRRDGSWQAKAEQGFDLASFAIDWERQSATCPQGQTTVGWSLCQDAYGEPRIQARFAKADCLACAARTQCVRSPIRPRTIQFRPQELHIALQAARQRQETEPFKQTYARRAGVEGTISQATRSFGLRRSRYVGLEKTRLQHILTAVAINLTRLAAWFEQLPIAGASCSRFATLAPAAAIVC